MPTRGVYSLAGISCNLDDGRVVSVRIFSPTERRIIARRAPIRWSRNMVAGRTRPSSTRDGRHPRLFRHAHGGRLFTLALDEADIAAAVNAARDEGKDPAKLVRKMANDVIFSAGGWSQVEAATGWQIADAPDIGALTISTIPGSQMVVLPPATGTELVPLDSGNLPAVIEPLDPDRHWTC